jgi:dCTP deaminase
MAIKSDRWIREMSEKHGMIEPYAENQVRLDENGQKVHFLWGVELWL